MSDMKCLKQTSTGQLFAFTDELAKRADMVPYSGPRRSSQDQTNVASEQTLAENVAETNRKVEQMLRDTQGQLDEANAKSAHDRNAFEEQARRMRELEEEIARLRGQPLEPVEAPAPLATLAEPGENMQVVATTADAADTVPAVPAVTPESAKASDWALPDNAEVLAHTDTPVVTAPEAPVAPPAAPSAPPAPVVPEAAKTLAQSLGE